VTGVTSWRDFLFLDDQRQEKWKIPPITCGGITCGRQGNWAEGETNRKQSSNVQSGKGGRVGLSKARLRERRNENNKPEIIKTGIKNNKPRREK